MKKLFVKKNIYLERKPQLISLEEEENICRWIDEHNYNGLLISLSDLLIMY